ncbi:MAG TPA: 2-succinyl-5-enolpyruvyl-6-hydroxy-3-cyclohexene-1-carboxylic-acid synthase [Solirubrobacteraceae bacterium]|nr:2-succinyl-5-enolpyruvyl-6-hydroxy-3-cyclohexene-1-carboxylic-acid synthase [Solirubrobacteraceae bacterium]
MNETTDTYLLLRAFVDELTRCGLAGACTSPGSRSTPLVLTLVRQPGLSTWSHVDERVAGFFAVGVGKQTGRPAAVACTSGTAAAHYLPAVIEAHEARVPLVVLTADRPPELREVGAGQTIDQLKLYGDAVKWFFEVGTHPATPERLRWARQLAFRAYETAVSGRPGPVHLNFPLREPLVLDEPLPPPGDEPLRRANRTMPAAAVDLEAGDRAVIVAGRHERDDGLAQALPAAAAALGVPLLADPLSGARRGPAAVAHYDALLRDPAFAGAQRPDAVIRIGDLPTSKPLRQWLAALDARQVAFDPERTWQDPAGVVAEVIDADPATWARALAGPPKASSWLDAWRAADGAAAEGIAAALGDGLSEPGVARALAGLAPEVTVFTASSMPVRDVETFWPARDAPPRVLAHRGANGIDGTLAAAFGAAAAGGRVVVHLGDVALAHDLGALLSAPRLAIPLTIVLVDNGGGGIFDFLPVSTQRDAYEEHVATPTGLDPERVAALFGLRYEPVDDLAAIREAPGTLLHVRTDRAENVALHRRVWDEVAVRLAR